MTDSTAPILVGYDGSPASLVALDWALRRAERAAGPDTPQRVEVVYVADTSWDSESFTAAPLLQKHGELVLAGEAFHADSKAPHVEVTRRVLSGNPVEVLCAQAAELGAALLVVGSYRKDLHERLTTSAVSLKVAAAATVPVVVVPDVPHGHRAGVVVGIEGSDSSAAVLGRAVDEARLADEPLTVVSAWTMPPMTMPDFSDDPALFEALEERAQHVVSHTLTELEAAHPGAAVGVEVATSVVLDAPAAALLQSAADAALLVVGSHGRRGLARFLLGSVSHDVILHAPCPVLVLRVA